MHGGRAAPPSAAPPAPRPFLQPAGLPGPARPGPRGQGCGGARGRCPQARRRPRAGAVPGHGAVQGGTGCACLLRGTARLCRGGVAAAASLSLADPVPSPQQERGVSRGSRPSCGCRRSPRQVQGRRRTWGCLCPVPMLWSLNQGGAKITGGLALRVHAAHQAALGGPSSLAPPAAPSWWLCSASCASLWLHPAARAGCHAPALPSCPAPCTAAPGGTLQREGTAAGAGALCAPGEAEPRARPCPRTTAAASVPPALGPLRAAPGHAGAPAARHGPSPSAFRAGRQARGTEPPQPHPRGSAAVPRLCPSQLLGACGSAQPPRPPAQRVGLEPRSPLSGGGGNAAPRLQP